MASNKCDRANRCKNSWWCAEDYNPANKDCFEPMPHFSQIKAMTDEELAEFMAELGCHPSATRETCKGISHCQECWMELLRQEVKE